MVPCTAGPLHESKIYRKNIILCDGTRKKKEYVLQRASPKQGEAYLEKSKTFPKKSSSIIDETALQTQMCRQYARRKPAYHRQASCSNWLVAAQREGTLLSPHTYSGTMKASLFEKWFEEKLLKKLSKEHVIIMDNAAFHKKEVLYQIAKKYSQRLIFLPPYSPEYNPIEHAWSALKRKVSSRVHLYNSVSDALDAVLEGN